jgi:hypothetical protein
VHWGLKCSLNLQGIHSSLGQNFQLASSRHFTLSPNVGLVWQDRYTPWPVLLRVRLGLRPCLGRRLPQCSKADPSYDEEDRRRDHQEAPTEERSLLLDSPAP